MGLSGSLITVTYVALFKPDIVTFILAVGIIFFVICVVGSFLLSREAPDAAVEETNGHLTARTFNKAYMLVFVLAGVLVFNTLVWAPQVGEFAVHFL